MESITLDPERPGDGGGLLAEVETLRTEVAALRAQIAAHVCAQPQMPTMPAAPIPASAAQPWLWRGNAWANACAGGDALPVIYEFPNNTVGATTTVTVRAPTAGCAGGMRSTLSVEGNSESATTPGVGGVRVAKSQREPPGQCVR